MSKKLRTTDLITVEEAASLLGVGQREVQIRLENGSLTRRRESTGELRVSRSEVERVVDGLRPHKMLPGETRDAYIGRLVADWPPPTEEQVKLITGLLYGGKTLAPVGPSPYELEQRRLAKERADALDKARRDALALTACDVCNIQPEQHRYNQMSGVDSHEWMPGRAEKLMKRRAKSAT